ncbi:homocitrate synthase [Mesotoga sp. SC_NapDC3]|uniref:LeuA family protein n=1 Tax=Mesotoga sp. TaxID=2053577 RepID=UPI000CC4FDF3|nr:homocitrate synthase [Mesotoga sp.]PNQ04098.1 homocitrate synthase [Mesotoga sp. SC_NapDC3]PXF33477.1 homocitrate synthase [Mesotoga sp. SC_NapDC]
MKPKDLDYMKLNGTPYFDESRWVSPLNYERDIQGENAKDSIYIHDVTLRDGEQTCGLTWSEDQRVRIGVALNDLGVKSIEVGMPIVSDENKRAIRRLVDMDLDSEIVPFARSLKKDIDESVDCGATRVVVEHAVNPYDNELVYGVSPEKLIDRVVSAILYAKEQGMKPTFMGWDATRSTPDYVLKVFTEVAKQAKPESIVFVDSFGVASPFAIEFIFTELRKAIPDIPLEFHVHNEFGLAMGSVFAAVRAGVSGIHSSINGLGERTGNVATEEVAAGLKLLMGIDTGVDLRKIGYTSRLVEDISKIPVANNKPVVGKRLFWVESGIVVDAIDKLNAAGINAAMTPYLPSLVGMGEIDVKLGAFSGQASIKYWLKRLGIQATEDQLEELTEIVRKEGRIRNTVLELDEFKRIVGDYMK